jgi:AcrR family transcriptional regulator
MTDGSAVALSGRRGQAARNDGAILEAARDVFLADPKAPIAAVAERAGVGISALYRRYANKEDLLRRLCADGLRRFITEAQTALADTEPTPRTAPADARPPTGTAPTDAQPPTGTALADTGPTGKAHAHAGPTAGTVRAAAGGPVAGSGSDGWRAFAGFLERIVDADVHSLTVRLAGTFVSTPEMVADAQLANELTTELVQRAQAGGRLRADVVAQDVGLVLESCAAIRVADPHRTVQLRRRHLAILLAGLSAAGAPLPGPPPRASELNSRWRHQ